MTFETISNGFLFGFWDNGIVVGGIIIVAWLACRKVDLEQREKLMRLAYASAFVASLSNALSDFVGAIGDPTMWSNITGITFGCLFHSVWLGIVLFRMGIKPMLKTADCIG
jgi:hypothetical protein